METTLQNAMRGPDPLFALLDGHEPRWTKRAVLARCSALTDTRWRNLRRGLVSWSAREVAQVAPLVGRTPAQGRALLVRSGRPVRRDGRRYAHRPTGPRAPRSSPPSPPSDAASGQAA